MWILMSNVMLGMFIVIRRMGRGLIVYQIISIYLPKGRTSAEPLESSSLTSSLTLDSETEEER